MCIYIYMSMFVYKCSDSDDVCLNYTFYKHINKYLPIT